MITLNQLKAFAAEEFPDVATTTILHLFMVWGNRDTGELREYIAPAGLLLPAFRGIINELLVKPDATDRELFIAAIAKAIGSEIMGRDLLKAAAVNPRHRISRALADAGLNLEILLKRIEDVEDKKSAFASVGMTLPAALSPILSYGRDLTKLAKEGAFDELHDLPEELNRLTDVLLRKRKGNPVLTGSAGVGKTALVELLARDAANNPASSLSKYSIFELSMGKLVAGTKYRGEFEARFEGVMKSLKDAEPAILFIDEIHLLLGSGRAEGAAMDGANLIKPFLARDGFRVIGATTGAEYQRYIARDEALARRFHQIALREPEGERLLAMVSRQAGILATHHAITLAEGIVPLAIELTNTHITNRTQPDKTIDLLDSSMVAARREGKTLIDEELLLSTLARICEAPVATLTRADRGELKLLGSNLKKRIIGQDHAVNKVASSLIQARLQIGRENRPLGVFLFAGDTGVGKTELARTVAAEYFGNEQRLLIVDLAEYSGPTGVHKLIGAPAGYVGYDDEGVLIRGLQKWNSCVILFDEAEKADPEVHKLLLGILDNGRITSGKGDRYDARQCIVIMTTNAVTSRELERQGIGFGASTGGDPHEILSKTFPREFLGRLDEIIPFHTLSKDDMRRILALRLSEQEERLGKKKVLIVADRERLLDHLLSKLERIKGGGREIKRLLERELLQPLALALLEADGRREVAVELGDGFYENGEVEMREGE